MPSEQNANRTLREGFDYPLSKIDPFGDHIDPPSVALYETLVVKGPDGRAHPGLAERWEISDDKLTWRFHLRPGARFHSGDRADAPAVIAAMEMLRWGFHQGNQLWYWDPVDRVYPEGEETIVFTLHHPYVRLPSLLWGTHTAIHNEALRAREPERHGYELADGTGPFRLVSWAQERVELERWPEYPGSQAGFLSGRGNVDRIEWISMLEPDDRVATLERGEVDCIHGPNYADVARLEADPRFRVVRFSQASNAYLALDWRHTHLGFDDLRVRRAISLGIDRDRLVRDALLGYGAPTFGPLSPGGEFYDPVVEQGRNYDRAAAERLLDEAGWLRGEDGVRRKGETPLSFECVIQDDTIHKAVAAGVQACLREIGVDFQPKPVLTFKGFYAACEAGPPAFINKWLWQDTVDAAIGFTASWGRPTPNWQHASVPALDEAYREWLRAETDDELQRAATKAQLLVADELPYIPLLVPHDVWVHATRVQGWEPAQAILYPFYHRVSLQDD
ncbi:MAG: ABC transporter substrate-binding protein [Thermomicrobiales bacterium]|nr:ABC transporter substrate-binding protein [Thermomicrobiales bacterium]